MQRNFLINIFSLTLGIASIGVVLFTTILEEYYSVILLYPLFLFCGITILFHALLTQLSYKKPIIFIRKYLLASFFKLFLYIIIFILYIYLNQEQKIASTIVFLLLYILYTFFEIVSLRHLLKRES